MHVCVCVYVRECALCWAEARSPRGQHTLPLRQTLTCDRSPLPLPLFSSLPSAPFCHKGPHTHECATQTRSPPPPPDPRTPRDSVLLAVDSTPCGEGSRPQQSLLKSRAQPGCERACALGSMKRGSPVSSHGCQGCRCTGRATAGWPSSQRVWGRGNGEGAATLLARWIPVSLPLMSPLFLSQQRKKNPHEVVYNVSTGGGAFSLRRLEGRARGGLWMKALLPTPWSLPVLTFISLGQIMPHLLAACSGFL